MKKLQILLSGIFILSCHQPAEKPAQQAQTSSVVTEAITVNKNGKQSTDADYAGIYSTDVEDVGSKCMLTITITNTGSGLSYKAEGPGKNAEGDIKIVKQEDGLYFEFDGWKQLKNDDNVVALYEPGRLTIMNYASYSEDGDYQVGGGCDAKWIPLEKQLHESIRSYKHLDFVLETSKFRVRVDEMQNDSYRYTSWPVNGNMSTKPDLVIENGKWMQEEDSGNNKYIFRNNDYIYIIITDKNESPNAKLIIFKGDQQLLSQKAKIITR